MKLLRYIQKMILLSIALSVSISSCDKNHLINDDSLNNDENATSLTFSLGIPTMELTRSYNDPDSNPAEWSDWDKYVDGQKLYRVTFFLISEDNTLVGFRDLDLNNQDENNKFNSDFTNIQIAFDYNNPKNGSIEKLYRGNYRLMAIANYSAVKVDEKEYVGLTEFSNQVEDLISNFNTDKGIENFTATNYSSFFDAQLDAGEDYICPQTPQPLTFITDFTLHPGNNTIEGKLIRSYSRIRINIENMSKEQALSINSLNLSTNFAQRKAYLFDDPNQPERKYTITDNKGAPSLTSNDAIQTFSAMNEANNNRIAPLTQRTIFDAYILESKDEENNYTYELDVEYEGVTDYLNFIGLDNGGNSIQNVTDLNKWYDDGGSSYFLMNCRYSPCYYLCTDQENAKMSHENISDLNNITSTFSTNNPKLYVWKLEKHNNTDSQYYLKSVLLDKYVGNPINNVKVPIIDIVDNYFNLTQSNSNEGIAFRSSGENNLCINVSGGNGIVHGYSNAGPASAYHLYPITYTNTPQRSDKITLTTIDPNTAHVTEVSEIKRNSFINALITVAYHNNNGLIEFQTIPWGASDNEIEFN